MALYVRVLRNNGAPWQFASEVGFYEVKEGMTLIRRYDFVPIWTVRKLWHNRVGLGSHDGRIAISYARVVGERMVVGDVWDTEVTSQQHLSDPGA